MKLLLINDESAVNMDNVTLVEKVADVLLFSFVGSDEPYCVNDGDGRVWRQLCWMMGED